MLKYIVIGIVILVALAVLRRLFGRPAREPNPPREPKMIAAEGGAVMVEAEGEEIDVDPATLAEIRALATSGRTIEAIKRLREVTDLDLARAKDIVESLQRMPPR